MDDLAGDDLCFTPATELVHMIRARDVSPVEIVDALLDRIERVDPLVNAFVTLDAEAAREHAARATDEVMAKDPRELGPLHGIPTTFKDLTETAGLRTTFGSEKYADHIPDEDALIVARTRSAGAIVLGKTTTPEFGSGSVTESRLTGITNNPWNLELTTGGSSGGAAASVVAGMGPLATGSDGGGSIRVPSSLCGAVGLKASSGRIPHSIEGPAFELVGVVGPITRTVADNALFLSVLAGYDPQQPHSLPDRPDFLRAVDAPSVAGMRIAYSKDLGAGPVEPDVGVALDAAAAAFADLGAVVETIEISLPDPLDYFVSYWGQLALYEKDGVSAEDLTDLGQEVVALARKLKVEDFIETAFVTRSAIFAAFARVFDHYDLMIWPTTKMVAYPHHAVVGAPTHIGPHEIEVPSKYPASMVGAVQNQMFTEAVSHAGLPAISIPAGFTPGGLPVGLQIASRQYDDYGVLNAAAAFEQARPWTDRRPALP
jgi:Asp-tRNA(Asn)/Glu-tRNA(Gln) amidotransferase A subunit family amidase